MKRLACLMLVIALLTLGASPEPRPATDQAPQLPAHLGPWGVQLSDRDPSVRPGDDFFMWENGAWFSHAQILPQAPAAAYWRDLRIQTPFRLRTVLTELAAANDARPGSVEAMALKFYESYLDVRTVDARGLAPLTPELDEVRAASTKSKMAMLMGRVESLESQRDQTLIQPIGRGFFTLNILQDRADPDRYAVYLGQGGLHLLGPEYYLDPKLEDIKASYEAYVFKMLTLIHWPDAKTKAHEVVQLETRIAEVSWSHEQMADQRATYNPVTVTQLSRLAPGFDWRAYLRGAELSGAEHVVIDAKPAFPKIAQIFADTPIDVLQARQAFSAADNGAPRLSAPMVAANYEFRQKILSGQSVVTNPRWVLAIREMQVDIGDVVTKLYVSRYFTAESRSAGLAMAADLRTAFGARLAANAWLSATTKARAQEKLAKLKIDVGYPSELQTYAGLKIEQDDLYGNAMRATAYQWRRRAHRLNAPFDRAEWQLAPDVANYNYVPTSNRVEMPAASFQPPFFDPKADPAVNYGAIGALMGMAIVAGFDDQGRHYDSDGRLRDWWTSEDAAAFDRLVAQLGKQYGAFEPLPGIHVKGDLAVTTAIGDVGGLELALDAYHLSLKGRPAPVLDGFTGDQRVFMGWAQLWRAKMRAAFVRMLLATGANVPPNVRVNASVRNIDAWYDAFDVKPGEALYLTPSERVRLW